jgi:signal transduction histidine kinase
VIKLRVLNNSYIAIRDTKGRLVEESNTNIPSEAIKDEEDIRYTLENKSYYIIKKYENRKILLFSYPLYLENKLVGIISFREDYTQIYNNDRNLINIITFIQTATIILSVLFSYILIRRITRPLNILTDSIENMRQGDYEGDIEVKSKDEIGTLANAFNIMKKEIGQYIVKIKSEKEKVLRLENTRKEFFNNITHELKTPLTGISSYAQILAQGTDDKEFSKRAAVRIKEESDRLHDMVLDLIEISKGNTEIDEEIVSVDISEMIQKVVKDLEKKAEKFEVDIVLKLKKVQILGREQKLYQLFINIIDNAIKYGSSNTDIIIALSSNDGFANISVENLSDVKDVEDTEELFAPFKKAGNREKGSRGLGLSICRKITELHGGTIEMQWKNYKVKTIIKLKDGNILETS